MLRKMLVLICLFAAPFARAGDIPAWTAQDILARLKSPDTVYIVNFWATWCVPCVQELPVFNELQSQYAGKPVCIILVSLDFKEDYPARLDLFRQRKHLAPMVAWLAEADPNKFIPQIDPDWQGSIPATWIVSPGLKEKVFSEGTITTKTVRKKVDDLLLRLKR